MVTMIEQSRENPFPGLRPFRGDESHLFFGRESQVDMMVDKLARTRFLAVVGTSGSGKSSLVNCGLRPALHGGLMAQAGIRWRMVQFRPGDNPLRAMARALAEDDAIRGKFDFDLASLQDLIEASLRMSKLGLSEIYKRAQLSEGTNLLIVVDQFEELFRYRGLESSTTVDCQLRSQEASAFVNLLLDAKAQARYPIYVALTMRSDFLGECAEFVGLPEAINDGQYLVPRLTRDERRAAIAGPVGVGGARISPVLLTRLVNDVGDNPDQLSILQHALNRTWACWRHEAKQEGELDLSHYEAIGTMAHALDLHAEKAYSELHGQHQQKICEKIFKALTDKEADPRGIRRPTKFSTLCELAGASPAVVTEVLNVFREPSRSFLMPPLLEVLEPETVVDISHESLMRVWERLKLWTDEEVQSARLYRRLSETAEWHAVGKAGLWDDPDLQFALDWNNKEQPTERWAELYGGGFTQAMSFLAESQRQHDNELQEKEELSQRDLKQAQALAEERQQRIEQQAQAARRLRGWLAALAGVAALLLLAAGYARHEEIKATQALAEKKVALDKAISAEKQAEAADRAMRLEALHVREANLDSWSNYADLTDTLLQNASQQEAAMWNGSKGEALMALGNYEDVEPLLTQALAVAPDDVNARTSRGYLFLLRNEPKNALKDFEYIRKHIDPGFALNYLNLTVAQAELGDYAAARTSLQKAIKNTQSKEFDGGSEAAVPPDITEATGRTTLTADKAIFEVALYYMQANLEAYIGGRDTSAFEEALARADKKAEPLPEVMRSEAYFIAMTWAWLHLSVRCPDSNAPCKDYGALVSEAALWERAGETYKPWAACYYQRFQDKYARWGDTQYASLAHLVEQEKKQLDISPSSSCFKASERDALTLETEAREALAKKKFREATSLFDLALDKAAEPDKMHLLLGKAYALYLKGKAAENHSEKKKKVAFLKLKKHCDEILMQSPREAKVYYYRAIAQDWLDPSSASSREKILADIQKALALNPADVDSLRLLDDLAPDDQPGEDIAYLKHYRPVLVRYYRMSPYTPNALLHQAKLAKEDKQFEQSLTFIQTAINMQPDDLSLYQVRKEIEAASGVATTAVQEDLIHGYVQALFVVNRRGNREKAEEYRDRLVDLLCNDIAALRAEQKDRAGMFKAYEAAVAVRQDEVISEPANASAKYKLAKADEEIGDGLRKQGELLAALDFYTHAEQVLRDTIALADKKQANTYLDHLVDNVGKPFLEIGDAFRDQGDLAKAHDSYELCDHTLSYAIRSRPDNAAYWEDRYYLYDSSMAPLDVKRGQFGAALNTYQQALEAITKAAELDSTRVDSYYLGLVYEHVGDASDRQGQVTRALESYNAAEQEFMRAIRLTENDPDRAARYWNELCVLLMKAAPLHAGEDDQVGAKRAYSKAREAIGMAVKLNPEESSYRATRSALETKVSAREPE